MISPPAPDDLYPGALPSVWVQWRRLALAARLATLIGPASVVGLAFALDVRAGATIAVLVAGMVAASFVYAKNRTDRHNAAVARGEIPSLPDPHFRPTAISDLPPEVADRAAALGHGRASIGRAVRFEGGWILGQRRPQDLCVVLGDDGGWARFDPRWVSDLWAVQEYRAGRGRDG